MCAGAAMSGEEEFRIRPGRVHSRGAQRARPFVAQALAAAQKAGGSVSSSGRTGSKRSRFGKGQRASIQANRFITARSRGAVVKARVVRNNGRAAAPGVHLTYLRREGVTRDGEPPGQKARLFGPQTENADAGAFAERCSGDRHHFRFIVSPDDASQMTDLRGFTRDLMGQAERDLETKLDWVGVDHWNTGHPHIHVIMRGVRDDGSDLVISRDYISAGMRDRARDLITQELGPRTELEIHPQRRVYGILPGRPGPQVSQAGRSKDRDAGRAPMLPTAPGLGFDFDEAAVDRARCGAPSGQGSAKRRANRPTE